MNGELDKIRQVAADVFDVDLSKVAPDGSPASIESWDSLTHLNFVVALEQTYGFTVEPEESERMGKGIAETLAVVTAKLGR
jgi:acyl carrier protein